MASPHVSDGGGIGDRPGFTLIELLVVVGIIGLLVTIGLLVGHRVIGAGKQRATEDVIRVLDTSLAQYFSSEPDGIPKFYTYHAPNGEYQYAMVDGRDVGVKTFDDTSNPPPSTIPRYTAMAATVPAADGALRSLNARFVRRVSIDTIANNEVPSTEILDGWGRPIRMVHPAFDGGSGSFWDGQRIRSRDDWKETTELRGGGSKKTVYRRSYQPFDPRSAPAGSHGDADEGICTGGRPYFYSCGADGDAGSRGDNVYSTRPSFPTETAGFAQ